MSSLTGVPLLIMFQRSVIKSKYGMEPVSNFTNLIQFLITLISMEMLEVSMLGTILQVAWDGSDICQISHYENEIRRSIDRHHI